MGIERIWILFLLPFALAMILFRREKSFIRFPSLETIPKNLAGRLFSFCFRAIPVLLVILLIFLAAGFKFPVRERVKYGYGADIVFLLDESGSMREPFAAWKGWEPGMKPRQDVPSKFIAAKNVISKFMEKRRQGQDRYGLTVFGASAVRVLPLSVNHELFLSCLEAQECILTATVLYHPFAAALNELMRSGARSRIIVFVSDGGGPLDEKMYGFSTIMKKYGIRLYWVAIGQHFFDEIPELVNKLGPLGKRIDASNPSELEKGFTEIHESERSLIIYKTSTSLLSSSAIAYLAFFFMVLIWASHSLTIYRRKAMTA